MNIGHVVDEPVARFSGHVTGTPVATASGDYGGETVTFRVDPSPSAKVEDANGDCLDVKP